MRRRANQRQARQHHEQIVAGDDGRILSISIRKSHSGNQRVFGTYIEGNDALVFSCESGGACSIEVNGRSVSRHAIFERTADLALGANELLAGIDWAEDIPEGWLDVVCAISLGLAFSPPVGTAIGGPTALGRLAMMGMDEI